MLKTHKAEDDVSQKTAKIITYGLDVFKLLLHCKAVVMVTACFNFKCSASILNHYVT